MHEPNTSPPTSDESAQRVQQAWAHAARHYARWRAQPTWVHRFVAGFVLLIFLGLAVILLVSSFVIGIVVVAVGALAVTIAALIRRIRGDGLPSKGRKNVRVIVRRYP